MSENLIFGAMSHSNALLGYGSCGCCHGECYTTEEDDREVAAATARGLREVCTIRTVEQLDALPVASVIKLGDLPGGIYEKDRKGSWGFGCWGDEYQQIIISAQLEALTIHLIWSPDWARP